MTERYRLPYQSMRGFPPLISQREPYAPDQEPERPRGQGEKPLGEPQMPEKPSMDPNANRVVGHLDDALASLWRAYRESDDLIQCRQIAGAIESAKEAQLKICVPSKDIS